MKRKEKPLKTFPYDGGQSKCDICLTEKLLIFTENDEFLPNKKKNCRHNKKFLLECFVKEYSLDYFLLSFDNVIDTDDCVPRSHETPCKEYVIAHYKGLVSI